MDRAVELAKSAVAACMLSGVLAGCVGTTSATQTATRTTARTTAESPSPNASLTSFLEGHWIHDENGTVMEETWFPPHPADGATAGMLRWTNPDGSVRMYELMSLTPLNDGTVTFQLRHFGPDLSPWKSETDGPLRGIVDRPEPNRLVIRCTERHGDVASITYERTGDQLVSTLRFRESSGRDPIVIDFVTAQ